MVTVQPKNVFVPGGKQLNGKKSPMVAVPVPAEWEGEVSRKNENEHSLSDFDYMRVTKEDQRARTKPLVTFGQAPFAKKANISGISAASKAGKTATKLYILAGAISATGEYDGHPDIIVEPNPYGRAVIDIDTEQAEDDQEDNICTVLRRVGIDETPGFLRSYNARQLGLSDYQSYTSTICELCSKEYNGVHLIVIDGGADYISSVNDEQEAQSIIKYFVDLSIKHDCPVIVVLHLNPGSEKERGHFGSELQRKCYGLVTITKENDISTISPKFMRKAGGNDMPLIHFQYSSEKGYHVPIGAQNVDRSNDLKQRQRLCRIAAEVFAPPFSCAYAEAINRIMDVTSKKKSTAKTMLGDMVGFGQVLHDGDFYRLNIDKVKMGQNGSIDLI